MKLSKAQAKKLGLPLPKRKHKYGAVATTVDGIRFSSKREAKRYAELKLMEKAGEIADLVLQPVFHLHAEGGAKIGEYIADFSYRHLAKRPCSGTQYWSAPVIEDVKGYRTPLYRWKKRHAEAEHWIVIREI